MQKLFIVTCCFTSISAYAAAACPATAEPAICIKGAITKIIRNNGNIVYRHSSGDRCKHKKETDTYTFKPARGSAPCQKPECLKNKFIEFEQEFNQTK